MPSLMLRPTEATRAPTLALVPSRALALLGLVTLGALLLRLWRIDAASYWSDELFSIFWVREPLRTLWGSGLIEETSPPLYYTLLKGWVAWFGDTEAAVRGLSALASALAVPLAWALARQVASPRAALLAALLVALSPLQLLYAQEARAYALLPVLYGIAVLSLLRGAWLVYGLAALALVYTHATSAFTLAALNLGAFIWLLARRDRAGLRRLVLADAVVVALSLPQIIAMVAQQGRFDLAWIDPPDAVALANLGSALFSDPTPTLRLRLAAGLAAGVVGLLGLGLWWLRPRGRVLWLVAVPPVLFLAATLGLSLWSPFFLPRIAVWLTVPLAVLAALVVAAPRVPRLLRGGLALLLALGIGFGLRGVAVGMPQLKEDWRGAAASIAPRLGPADVLAIGPRTNPLGLVFYLDATRAPLRWQPAGAPPMPLAPSPENVPEPRPVDGATLAARLREGHQVFLLLNARDTAEFLAAAEAELAGYPLVVERGHALLTLLSWSPAGPR